MVVVRADGSPGRPIQKAGTVSSIPTDNDVWAAEIRVGMALVKGEFVNARYWGNKLAELKAIGDPIHARKSRKFSKADLLALKVARAWLAGNGDGAKYWARQLGEQLVLDARGRR